VRRASVTDATKPSASAISPDFTWVQPCIARCKRHNKLNCVAVSGGTWARVADACSHPDVYAKTLSRVNDTHSPGVRCSRAHTVCCVGVSSGNFLNNPTERPVEVVRRIRNGFDLVTCRWRHIEYGLPTSEETARPCNHLDAVDLQRSEDKVTVTWHRYRDRGLRQHVETYLHRYDIFWSLTTFVHSQDNATCTTFSMSSCIDAMRR
jgi:hypothetical protein